jgi:glycosyltransferase involved in cell wall biosynthesis
MRILFCSLDAYSLFNTKTNFIFGGAEVRSFTIAKGLAKHFKQQVYFLTRDHGQEVEKINEITVIPFPGKFGHGYWLKQKNFIQKLKNKFYLKNKSDLSLSVLIKKIQPDVIVSLSLSPETIELFELSRNKTIPFVIGLTSDNNLELNNSVDDSLTRSYKDILKNAKVVITQTEFQQKQLYIKYNRIGIKLSNPISLNLESNKSKISEVDFLWVGKSSRVKQAEVFVQLSRRMPEYSFRMILNVTDTTIYSNCVKDKPTNLEIINQISFQESDTFFIHAKVLVNTSLYEGFPNAFLQAAKYKKTILSLTVDPNNFLTEFSCGLVALNSTDKLCEYAKTLMSDSNLLNFYGENGFNYVSKFHDEKFIVQELNEILSKEIDTQVNLM